MFSTDSLLKNLNINLCSYSDSLFHFYEKHLILYRIFEKYKKDNKYKILFDYSKIYKNNYKDFKDEDYHLDIRFLLFYNRYEKENKIKEIIIKHNPTKEEIIFLKKTKIS